MKIEVISPRIRYHDLLVRIIVSLIAAHFIIAFGIDKTFFELLTHLDYYLSLLGSGTIAFGLFSFIRYVTKRLDKVFPWNSSPLQRLVTQFFFGLVLASILAFIFAFTYFRIYGKDILTTVYLKYDFPVIVLFLLMLNLYYFAYYVVVQLKIIQQPLKEPSEVYSVVFVVSKGTENIPIQISSIAYFFHEGEYNFIRLFDGTNYLITQALDDIEKQLNPVLFFRVNRQMIASFKSCRSYQTLEHSKLELFVEPSMKEPVIISQKRSAGFKKWLERKVS